jgi:hypothetical protein
VVGVVWVEVAANCWAALRVEHQEDGEVFQPDHQSELVAEVLLALLVKSESSLEDIVVEGSMGWVGPLAE